MFSIGIIGMGFVGTTMACAYSKKANVYCYDNNPEVVQKLKDGISPIPEPMPRERITSLNIENEMYQVLDKAKIIFVCIGTQGANNTLTLEYLEKAFKKIEYCLKTLHDKTIVLRSTVPIGTTRKIFNDHISITNEILHQPEFFEEGKAYQQIVNQEYYFIGTINGEKTSGAEWLQEFYTNKDNNTEFRFMLWEETEMAKFTLNAFLSTRIAFSNEIASLCCGYNINANAIWSVLKHDKRISLKHMKSGLGFGGSCLQKDLDLVPLHSQEYPVLANVLLSNYARYEYLCAATDKYIYKHFENINNIKVAFIGLSFKPNSGDTRNSPAIKLLNHVSKNKRVAIINVFDDVAEEVNFLTDKILRVKTMDQAFMNADICIYAVNHISYIGRILYRDYSIEKMKHKIIIDFVNGFASDFIGAILYQLG